MVQRKKSKYERRAARQRQMEEMEAAASGTNPSMALDTSATADVGIAMRQRNQETARRFLYDEDEAAAAAGATTTNKTTASHNLFGGDRGEQAGMTTVNLMDHETGVYTQPEYHDDSFWGRLTRFVGLGGSASDQPPSEHDAIAADSEVYLGGGEPIRASRVSSLCVRVRMLFCLSMQRCLLCLVLFVALFIATFYAAAMLRQDIDAEETKSAEQLLYEENVERHALIKAFVEAEGLSKPDKFKKTDSAQSRALRWIAYSDEARLSPTDPAILPRYALAVFFYDSFSHFERTAGHQPPIENVTAGQWELVPVAGWYSQRHWLSRKGYCEWHGVECELRNFDGISSHQYDANGDVYALNLTDNYVHGTIPGEFRAFAKLERLDLSHNRLQGDFPSEVPALPLLRHVRLEHNEMNGALPKEIGEMKQARELVLSNNKFSGSVPSELESLSLLETLDLSHNRLSKKFPSIFALSNLKHLRIADNQFSGTVPLSFAELTQVREIHMEQNQFSGRMAVTIGNLQKLIHLSMHENLISGEFPNHLLDNSLNLEYLSAHHNRFSGSIPTSAGQLKLLQTLSMNDNLLTGTFPTEWTNMPALTVLHLQNNKMHGPVPGTIGNLKTLQELWLGNNTLDGALPPELGDCSALETAYLDRNLLEGVVPSHVGNLPHLQTLRLEHNPNLQGPIPQALCNLKITESLRFVSADCGITCSCCDKCY